MITVITVTAGLLVFGMAEVYGQAALERLVADKHKED